MRAWPLLPVGRSFAFSASSAFALALLGACSRQTGPTITVTYVDNAPKKHEGAPTYLIEVGEGGLGLFHDEALEAEVMVASWAVAHGFSVVAPQRAHEVFDRARAGKDATTGAACGAPLSESSARERWQDALGATGRLNVWAACDEAGTCALEVLVEDSLALDAKIEKQMTAPFDVHAPWRDALRTSIDHLASKADEAGGGLGMVGGVMGAVGGSVEARPERLHLSTSSARTADAKGLDDALLLPDGTAPLRECLARSPVDAEAELLVEIDRSGRVARCQSRDEESVTTTCACQALTEHARAAPMARGKRLHTHAALDPADVVTAGNGVVVVASAQTYVQQYVEPDGEKRWRPSVSDAAIAYWKPPTSARLMPCFADAATTGEMRMATRVAFDASGRAVGAEARATSRRTPSPAELECVKEALRFSEAPCPSLPGSIAEAEVYVRIDRRAGAGSTGARAPETK